MYAQPKARFQRSSASGSRWVPVSIRDGLVISAAVWLGLMAYWALADALIGRYPPGGRQISPEGFISLLIYATLGLAGLWAAHRTGFPSAWDTRIPEWRR